MRGRPQEFGLCRSLKVFFSDYYYPGRFRLVASTAVEFNYRTCRDFGKYNCSVAEWFIFSSFKSGSGLFCQFSAFSTHTKRGYERSS